MRSRFDQPVDDYLKRLDAELGDAPRARRRDLVQEIGEHVAEARADLAAENETEVRNLLERLGFVEVAAVVLLLVGGLWASAAWSVRDKLVAPVVVPDGLALPLFLVVFPVSLTTAAYPSRRARPPAPSTA
jgi:hypothetical protein